MDIARIFIASSGRTLTLAEKLRDELQTEFCEATLWSEEGRHQPGATIIEMLEKATRTFDFAVIILARDDVMVRETGDTLKARDNCVFEAGLFNGVLGRERCFLVNSVEQRDLPSDLGGIISLPFKEPTDLSDRDACARAIKSVSAALKDSVQRAGSMRNRKLSAGELGEREKSRSIGGDLLEGLVVIACTMPVEFSSEGALQVKKNIDDGVRYVIFVHGSLDGARKICRLLQMLLLAPMLDREEADNFAVCASKMKDESIQRAIVEDLKKICEWDSLKIFFLPAALSLQYCIHNATDDRYAKLYFKRGNDFIEWEEGYGASRFWEEEQQKQGIASALPPGVFHGASGFDMHMQESFAMSLKREVDRHFPGIHEQVTKLCFDGTLD